MSTTQTSTESHYEERVSGRQFGRIVTPEFSTIEELRTFVQEQGLTGVTVFRRNEWVLGTEDQARRDAVEAERSERHSGWVATRQSVRSTQRLAERSFGL